MVNRPLTAPKRRGEIDDGEYADEATHQAVGTVINSTARQWRPQKVLKLLEAPKSAAVVRELYADQPHVAR